MDDFDDFGDDYTSSTSVEPNSAFQGNDVKKLSDEMDFKLKLSHKRRLARKHFMSTTRSSASKSSVPKKKKMAERNKTQTLDVEEQQHYLPRSYSFDSNDSRIAIDLHDDIKNNLSSDVALQPYDHIKNYLSPRPRYLKYNPDRRREIFARQNRVRRSASYDAGMRFPNEDLDSTLDCSLSEETDIFASEHEHETEHEHEEEKEEVFDDFEEGNGWNSKVFLQYLIVIIVLILTTITITSWNSPNLSPAKEAIWGFMNLYNKTYTSIFKTIGFDISEVGKLSKREIDVNHDEIWTEDVGDDDMYNNQLEGYKTEEIEDIQDCMYDEYHDEIWSKHDNMKFQDSHTNEIEEKEEISYELHEPVILISQQIYSDFDRGEVSEESEVLMVEDDVGKEDGNGILIKLARFDPFFAALIGVCVLILATLSIIIYYSKKSKLSTPVKTTISHQNSINNTKYRESFVNASPLTYKTTHSGSLNDSEAVSSSEAKSSYLEFSTESPSYGSFTVEERIVKKKKSKQPEVMLSPVRRSTRIHKRSVTTSTSL